MFEKPTPHAPSYPIAEAIIAGMPGMRTVRKNYAELERQRYGRSWGILELLDGAKGDLGDACKLETARRGVRGTDDRTAREHEWYDLTWSHTTAADALRLSPEDACQEAGRQGRVTGNARQLLNRYGMSLVIIDEAVDPTAEPLIAVSSFGRDSLVEEHLVEGYRTLISIAHEYDIDAAQVIKNNNTTLLGIIQKELQAS